MCVCACASMFTVVVKNSNENNFKTTRIFLRSNMFLFHPRTRCDNVYLYASFSVPYLLPTFDVWLDSKALLQLTPPTITRTKHGQSSKRRCKCIFELHFHGVDACRRIAYACKTYATNDDHRDIVQ